MICCRFGCKDNHKTTLHQSLKALNDNHKQKEIHRKELVDQQVLVMQD